MHAALITDTALPVGNYSRLFSCRPPRSIHPDALRRPHTNGRLSEVRLSELLFLITGLHCTYSTTDAESCQALFFAQVKDCPSKRRYYDRCRITIVLVNNNTHENLRMSNYIRVKCIILHENQEEMRMKKTLSLALALALIAMMAGCTAVPPKTTVSPTAAPTPAPTLAPTLAPTAPPVVPDASPDISALPDASPGTPLEPSITP